MSTLDLMCTTGILRKSHVCHWYLKSHVCHWYLKSHLVTTGQRLWERWLMCTLDLTTANGVYRYAYCVYLGGAQLSAEMEVV